MKGAHSEIGVDLNNRARGTWFSPRKGHYRVGIAIWNGDFGGFEVSRKRPRMTQPPVILIASGRQESEGGRQ